MGFTHPTTSFPTLVSMRNEKFSKEGYRLRAENARLRIRLRSVCAMPDTEEYTLAPVTENLVLKHLLQAQRLDRPADLVSIHSYLGHPRFARTRDLDRDELIRELARLMSLLRKNGISLTMEEAYEPATVYTFIVDELFHCPIRDVHLNGLLQTYRLEDYWTDDNYHLRQLTERFFDDLMVWDWNPEHAPYIFSDAVSTGGSMYGHNGITKLIRKFRQRFHTIEVEAIIIHTVELDEDEEHAAVHGAVRYCTHNDCTHTTQEGAFEFEFERVSDCWFVHRFEIPGFLKG